MQIGVAKRTEVKIYIKFEVSHRSTKKGLRNHKFNKSFTTQDTSFQTRGEISGFLALLILFATISPPPLSVLTISP